jgi:hypothetical protein
MKRGQLSEHFVGQAAKRLSAVEARPERSNQHEFNGVAQLARILGPAIPRREITARFLYLDDVEERVVGAQGTVTWYDARERHPTRSECRLYFPPTAVSDAFREGDLLVLGRRPDGTLLIVVAARGTTAEQQLLWLFGLGEVAAGRFEIRDEADADRMALNFASRRILEELGIDAFVDAGALLGEMLARFGGGFPRARDFSAYARGTVSAVSPTEAADDALLAWFEREEALFRTLERHLVAERLRQGFGEHDVDAFVAYSLSVHNRRKARAGSGLQNHLRAILEARSIRFTAQGVTENRATPDFLFPGIDEYRDPAFPVALLTMLGVKSSCKDRWRQVLAEADRIEHKHLLTLEPGISQNQTDGMKAKRLQLVVPAPLHATYSSPSAAWLWSVERFLQFVADRQARART